MNLTFGVCTDLHFGPEALYKGKLRKLTAHAGELVTAFAKDMASRVKPDFIVNLGDDIEDEDHDADLTRYGECLAALETANIDLVHVAGNHDTIHLSTGEVLSAWRRSSAWLGDRLPSDRLYYAFERGGIRFIVLHSVESPDRSISIHEAQQAWLAEELDRTSLPVIVLVHHSLADQNLAGSRWFEGRAHVCLVQERKEIRALLERHHARSERGVLAVFNGHLHWNHVDVIRGIPYVTVQSMIENLDEDAPGRPARAFAVVRVSPKRVNVDVGGEEPARYQFTPKE
ncbi:MAG: metallophosphoesterase [Polyangiaceae bacterium]